MSPVVSVWETNHRENHFEPRERLERVRLTGGHENHLAAMKAVRVACDADFCLAFDYLHNRIERGRVLAQALAFVEGEDRHAASGPFNDFAADDRAVLVVDEFKDLGDLRPRSCLGSDGASGFILSHGIVNALSAIARRCRFMTVIGEMPFPMRTTPR